MTERTFWAKLNRIGWLDYVPEATRPTLRAQIKKGLATDPDTIHLALNRAAFDAECIDEPGVYCKILKQLADESGSLFHPTKLEEEDVALGKGRYGIKVSFRHEGKQFSVTVPHHNDWFDVAVLDLVNQALEASGVEERFIILPADSQILFLALVPREVYEHAVAEKLIPTLPED